MAVLIMIDGMKRDITEGTFFDQHICGCRVVCVSGGDSFVGRRTAHTVLDCCQSVAEWRLGESGRENSHEIHN